jgi:hypothetical protein
MSKVTDEMYELTIKFLENEVKERDELLSKMKQEITLFLDPKALPIGYNYE